MWVDHNSATEEQRWFPSRDLVTWLAKSWAICQVTQGTLLCNLLDFIVYLTLALHSACKLWHTSRLSGHISDRIFLNYTTDRSIMSGVSSDLDVKSKPSSFVRFHSDCNKVLTGNLECLILLLKHNTKCRSNIISSFSETLNRLSQLLISQLAPTPMIWTQL